MNTTLIHHGQPLTASSVQLTPDGEFAVVDGKRYGVIARHDDPLATTLRLYTPEPFFGSSWGQP